MKKILAVSLLFLLMVVCSIGYAAQLSDITAVPPTQYTDNSVLTAAEQAAVVINFYMSTDPNPAAGWGSPIATTAPGGTTVTNVTVTATRGQTYYFTATATLNGMTSAYAPSVAYLFPFNTPKAPGGPTIHWK